MDFRDEAGHAVGEGALWGESYYADFVADDGALGGYVRLGFYPNLGVVWWTAAVVRPGRPPILSTSYDAPITDHSMGSAQGPGFSVDLDASDPLRRFTVRATAVGSSLDDPAAVYRGGAGTQVALGMELSWRTDGEPYHYGQTTRYEIPCLVTGDLQLGDRTVPIRAQGQRDHSWGIRDWWQFGWCWMAARLEDGTRVHAVEPRIPGADLAFGYVQQPGRPLEPVRSADVSEDLGPEGLPSGARAVLKGVDLELTIEPLAFGPLLLVSPEGRLSRFPRAMARFTDQRGRTGLGWVEWNQPERP